MIFLPAVLDTLVRVVHQRKRRASAGQCHFERAGDMPGLKTVMHLISHDFSRQGIRYQADIRRLRSQLHVGDIRHPYLFRTVGDDLIFPLRRDAGPAPLYLLHAAGTDTTLVG